MTIGASSGKSLGHSIGEVHARVFLRAGKLQRKARAIEQQNDRAKLS